MLAVAVELNKLVELIFQLDTLVDFGKDENLLYHQSRFWLFRHFQKNAEGLNDDKSEPIRHFITDLLCLVISAIRIISCRLRGTRPVMIIEHARHRGYKWNYGDPYFGATERDLARVGIPMVVIGINYGSSLNRVYRGKNVITIPRLILNTVRFLFGKFSWYPKSTKLIDEIADYLESRGLSRLLSKAAYTKRLQQIQADNVLLGLIVRLINPKAVLCVDAYNSNSSLILNANRLGVPTVEYQHGIISEGHLGYSFNQAYIFPGDVMPKHYIFWGAFWADKMRHSLARCGELRVGTYEYGSWCRARVKPHDRPSGVLFIMQPSAATFIENQVKRFKSRYPEVHVGVRYHPKQRGQLATTLNVQHHFHENIYDLFMRYKYVVGCFSTALFEAVAMQKQVFFMRIPGFDGYEDILKSAGIQPLSEFHELLSPTMSEENDVEIISDMNNVSVLSDLLLVPMSNGDNL
jgi:hypothetical protein